MSKKKESKPRAKGNSNWKFKVRSFLEVMNVSTVIIGILLAAIAVWPVILNWLQSPKLSLVRQTIQILDDRVVTEYSIQNKGSAIASEIFIQLQTFKGDQVYLPFAVTYDMRTDDSINWEISIKSLAPDEATQISIYSEKVEEFLKAAKHIKELTGRIPNSMPSIVSIDYREGSMRDVIREDSPELKEYVESQLEAQFH